MILFVTILISASLTLNYLCQEIKVCSLTGSGKDLMNAMKSATYDFSSSRFKRQLFFKKDATVFKTPSEICPFMRKIECDFTDSFRTIDGSCNNKVYIYMFYFEIF